MEMMKQVKRRRILRPCTQQRLEDVPEELIHRIQTLLPIKDAARTCVLSKSWMHAWSTIPALRFHQPVTIQEEKKYIKLIKRTLRRYRLDNIPMVSFDLPFRIHDQISQSLAVKWVKKVASKNSLKELYLTLSVNNVSFTLPDEIFSSDNLDTISVKLVIPSNLWYSTNPLIKCVKLRVLKLINVHITEEAFQNLLSTCSLLEKIELSLDLKTIKVKNFRYLRELKILPGNRIPDLEISDVPSLHFFSYDSTGTRSNCLSFNMCSFGSVRELFLRGVDLGYAFCDSIRSKLPFLENLTLQIEFSMRQTLDIACASLQRLTIQMLKNIQIDIHVAAPKLLLFHYEGNTMPSLSFPFAPDQIKLQLKLHNPIGLRFFVR